MNRPQPQSIIAEVFEALTKLAFDGGARLSKSSPEFLRFMGDLERAQKVDVISASCAKSNLLALAGDLEGALYWSRNATATGGKSEGRVAAFVAYALCGRPQQAYELVDEVFANLGTFPFHVLLRHMLSSGWFPKAKHFLAVCQDKKLVHKGIEGMDLIAPAAHIYEVNGLSEEKVNSVIEVAYEIMDAEETLWVGSVPMISLHDEDSDLGFVMIQFVLHRSPKEAAALSWKLAEELARRDLDVPGLIVGFAPNALAPTKEVVAA